MKKFLGAFGAIATAFAGQAAHASMPHPDKSVASPENGANDSQQFRAANAAGESHNFVLRRAGHDGVVMADHESHASHASHASHYSGD